MNITVTTVHDYNRILDFNITHNLSRKFTWIVLILCGLLSGLVFFVNLSTGELDYIDWVCFLGAVFLILFYAFICFILPRFVIKKSYFYGQTETMTFTEENMSYTTVSNGITSSGTVLYPTIIRVLRSRRSYFFYIGPGVAYIVDRAGIYEQLDKRAFEEFLLRALGKSKIRFKMQ